MVDSAQPSRNPANSTGEIAGTFREILGKFLNSSIDDMLPAIIKSYDRDENRATVQPLIALVNTDGDPIIRNQLASIPVLNIGGGGFILSFNFKPGDLGWIKACDRDIADFLKSYDQAAPATKRSHDFSNSLFIPDVMKGYTIAEEDAGNAVLQTLDGTVRVSLFPDKLKITAPLVEVDAQLITSTGNATIGGNLSVLGAANLGGVGALGLARLGDQVQIGPNTGTIITASTIHKAT